MPIYHPREYQAIIDRLKAKIAEERAGKQA